MIKVNDAGLKFASGLSARTRTTMIVIHHAAAKVCSVKDVHSWHLSNGWAGIGYHYFIRKDGTIWHGRPEGTVGAHARGYNAVSIGICCEGDYMSETIPSAQRAALVALVRDIEARHDNALEIKAHRDVCSTDCPGDNFPMKWVLDNWRKQEVKEVRYNKISDIPEWGKETIAALIKRGAIKGTETGLDLSEDMLRVLVIAYRGGAFNG